ncbi:MAG: hypothetical protein V3V99_11895 [candidate division Zixibacteria bacterium]
MSYWRMQLHPAEPSKATYFAAESLAAGFIGLDFAKSVGDLTDIKKDDLEKGKQDYLAFQSEMLPDDQVLIIVHHYPFALVKVKGAYNYIRTPDRRIGVWFRHFREITDVRYYADYVNNPKDWEKLIMTDAISVLKNAKSKSYQLIKRWLTA